MRDMKPEDRDKMEKYLGKPESELTAEERFELAELLLHNEGDWDCRDAVAWYEKAAEAGSAQAMVSLGDLYWDGWIWSSGIEADAQKGLSWYERAAKAGSFDAMRYLIMIYMGYEKSGDKNSDVETKDLEKALFWAKEALAAAPADKAARMQSAVGDALFAMASRMDHGPALRRDYKIDEQWEQDYNVEMVRLYREAIEWYEKAADGWTSAMVHIGDVYTEMADKENYGDVAYYNKEIGQNYYQAFCWYEKAAMKGNITAMERLYNCYEWGQGVPKDEKKALLWSDRAKHHWRPEGDRYKEPENAEEMYELGISFLYGRGGVSRNKKKAVEWFEKAAAQGNAAAMFQLGEIVYLRSYELDEEPKADVKKGLEWVGRAAEAGYFWAVSQLWYYYLKGEKFREGMPQDDVKAMKWALFGEEHAGNDAERSSAIEAQAAAYLSMSDKLDYGGAMLGCCQEALCRYERVIELIPDRARSICGVGDVHRTLANRMKREGMDDKAETEYREAFVWHLRAAEMGDFTAEGCVAEAYRLGLGTEPDEEKANEWEERAAKL